MKKIFRKFKSVILFLLTCLLLGLLIGFIEGFRGMKFYKVSGNFFFEIFILTILVFLSIIIHESGHLIGGLLTGYKFLSFRIGNLILVYNKGKFKLSNHYILGTGGQCLMIPPELDDNMDFAYKLYNLGGCILNILFGIMFIIIGLIYMQYICFIFGAINLYMGISNILPKNKLVANDGFNQVHMDKSKDMRISFWKMLKINQYLHNNRFKDMDGFLFEANNIEDIMSETIYIARANRLMDLGKYEDAKKLYIEIIEKSQSELQEKEILLELIYLNLILGDIEQAKEIYTKDLQKYIDLTKKYHMSKNRLLYAYYLIVERDFDSASKVLEKYKKIAKKSLYSGEVDMENELIYKVNEVYENLI